MRVLVATRAGLGNGDQPSASSTARRMARRLFPPIHIGGPGRWRGLGSMVFPEARNPEPSKVVLAPLQAARMAAMA